MAKMEAQQAAMKNKELEKEQEKKGETQRDEKACKTTAAPQRKSSRVSAVSEIGNAVPGKNPTHQKDSAPKRGARPAGKKRNKLKIADYFKKEDLKAKAGKDSMAEALEEAVEEQEHNPKALRAQILRSARQ